jgi:predicted phage baseplate assembly protein
VNPQAATGGADPESRYQARRNTPLAVMALDRLVSVQDYADFARTFAGVAKASAVRLSDGRRQLVHLTIAGLDDIPISTGSDLYVNLSQALYQFGDPQQPIEVDARHAMFIFIGAKIRVLPDYQWESVEPQVRAALLDAFSFERRDLGQDVLLSEVIRAIRQPAVGLCGRGTYWTGGGGRRCRRARGTRRTPSSCAVVETGRVDRDATDSALESAAQIA